MDEERTGRRAIGANEAPLPPERAFVVQLRPLSDPGDEIFVGRVEHIASGTVLRFRSAAELTEFIARIGDPRSRSAMIGQTEAVSGADPRRTKGKTP